ncbi:MAG: ATP-dependent zinc metalloprotease FtsH [Mycoplasmoidaceae bacterium]|nr:ATP-dependent zinc metalloprotease FtsH [Mycoplasmoidaceae bacterium]
MYNRMAKLQGGAMGGEDSIFGMGKSQAKIAHSNVKFTDVAGIEEEKAELIEIVDYLKNPDKYAAMGARTPRGVILYGPPGTGKTLLAKAVAGEAGVPFFQVSGSAFEDMLVGVGAKRVRDLFTKAKKAAPAIIFIDELDSVASKRGKYDVSGSSGLADQTINQLLAEMDGFSTKTGIVVMAATNRLDVIDDAILRPGRFDRHIQVNLPDIKEREAILKIHARNKNLSSKVNLDEIARRTPGFSGAQLENVLNEATLLAVRFNKSSVGMDEIDEAIDRVIAGPAKKSRVITEDEKKQIAYHEAGHALVGLHLPGSDVVEKITIIPRGRAAGYTLSTPEKQEIQIQKKSDLLAIISSTLGGRAAEEVIYGPTAISTGAANDLYKVTNIVRSMVTQLGMTEIGMTQFIPSEGVVNPGQVKLYSDETANKIDAQIEKIIQDEYSRAKDIIANNKKELDLIVESLLLLETIVKNQIDYIHKNLKLPEEAIKIKEQFAKAKKSKSEANQEQKDSIVSDESKKPTKGKK